MRATFLITILLTLLFSFVCVIFFKDPGYVLLSYKNTVLETSLLFFFFMNGLLFLSAIITWSLWRYMTGPNVGIQFWLASRGAKKAQENTTAGLIQFAEENWQKAEQLLVQSAEKSLNPLVNYLNAARAANKLGERLKRDNYLRLAMENTDGADIAVSLTQAELQFESSQWESCLATLTQLRGTNPDHSSVLKLLSLVFRKLNDWDSLRVLLPTLKKSKTLSITDYVDLERSVYHHILSHNVQSSNHVANLKATNLTVTWDALPSLVKKDIYLIEVYCQLLIELEDYSGAESILRHALTHGEWSDKLVTCYGRLKSEDPSQPLSTAEAWQLQHRNNAALTLALGRLSLQNRQSAKALEYFEASLKLSPTVDVYRELARLCEERGDTVGSSAYLQAGLTLVSQALPELPMPEKRITSRDSPAETPIT